MNTSDETTDVTRVFPMTKSEGFVPSVQRYTARFDTGAVAFEVLFLGVQSPSADDPAIDRFMRDVVELFAAAAGPAHFDFARYEDEAGYTNQLAVAYWANHASYQRWWYSALVADWWSADEKLNGSAGYFAEPLPVNSDALETIAFREYIRGLSACPMNSVEPTGESGYWGAARDRIPRSAVDRFVSSGQSLSEDVAVTSRGHRVCVTPPANYCVIRSGVSWEACGPEQLTSYRSNLEPKLNAGMDYLRSNPVDANCWSLRQVRVVDQGGNPAPETYVAGHFVSLSDLEGWAHHHPTHLAIFGQAQKERIKYQDDLELRTYHEVYIVQQPAAFEYVNCHSQTGALGLLPNDPA